MNKNFMTDSSLMSNVGTICNEYILKVQFSLSFYFLISKVVIDMFSFDLIRYYNKVFKVAYSNQYQGNAQIPGRDFSNTGMSGLISLIQNLLATET